MKVYKFRLYPSTKQKVVLADTLDMCRFLYNKLLEEKNNNSSSGHVKISHYIIDVKDKFPKLNNVYSKTLQCESDRLFNNLKRLRGMRKAGLKTGSLRFKGKKWFKTFMYNQSGFKLLKTGKRHDILYLSKIGSIRMRMHREIEGIIKGVMIKRNIDEWEAHIITNATSHIKSGTDEIGIDVGIINFITTSKGDKVENPLYLARSLERLKRFQRMMNGVSKDSNKFEKLRLGYNKIWKKIDCQRNDFIHKTTTNIVRSCSFIAVEDLDIKTMTEKIDGSKYRNMRNIFDSCWGIFANMLQNKAESADSTRFVKVDPAYTSRTCNLCGNMQEMSLSSRVFSCSRCGMKMGRDHNAAINILNKAKIAVVRGIVEPFGCDARSSCKGAVHILAVS